MIRFGLNLPKDDCQVSYIFVWMNLVLLVNFCQNLTYSKDSSCGGVTHQNTQIGTKSGSGCFHTPRFGSLDLESRVEL